MKLLTFNDANLEEHFAAHFGWRCRVPTFLLSLVMFLIWTTRLVSAQWRTDVPFLKFISGFLLVMAAFHLFNTVAIFRNPSLCCGEKRKATYVVFDAVACMFTVLVSLTLLSWILSTACCVSLLLSSNTCTTYAHVSSYHAAGLCQPFQRCSAGLLPC